jgi:predicted acylesterase/phospholipase RssA
MRGWRRGTGPDDPAFSILSLRSYARRMRMNDDSLTWVDVLNEEAEKLHGIKGKPNSLEELYKAIHGLDPCRAALCLSGGGIRSATFSLGVIQGLARADCEAAPVFLDTDLR